MNPVGGMAVNKMFTGIAPEIEESLLPYFRDIYHTDSVAGAAVDMIGTFPFSDWTLVGIDSDDMEKFNETLSRINFRALMPEISLNYLVDGAFVGSLVYDPNSKCFQDIMVHDRQSCQISPTPFFAADPIIKVDTAAQLGQFLTSGSPYVSAILEMYPRGFIDTFCRGQVELDPLTTLYIPRKTTSDSTTTSYFRRLLPMYFLEKTLYRGTLIEATKRMRATSLVQVGTDSWEPTAAEMQTILNQFQAAEMDPLGAWVVTRQGIQVQDIRTAGDMWKWTDVIDTMVPYKLRALGIHEAFLSGEAQFATAEAAMSVFTENMAAYRDFLSHRVFKNKLFPLIAVAHGLYVDKKKAGDVRGIGDIIHNLSNTRNLVIPELRWHKNLDNHDPSVMDTLEKLGDKGIPVPLKMWAAAANVDLGMLLGNLAEDKSIRDKITAITGVAPTDAGGLSENDDGFGEESQFRREAASLNVRSGTRREASRVRNLLNRDFGNAADAYDAYLSKSGKVVHAALNPRRREAQHNNNILRAMKALQDPHHRREVRNRVAAKFGGRFPNIITGSPSL